MKGFIAYLCFQQISTICDLTQTDYKYMTRFLSMVFLQIDMNLVIYLYQNYQLVVLDFFLATNAHIFTAYI